MAEQVTTKVARQTMSEVWSKVHVRTNDLFRVPVRNKVYKTLWNAVWGNGFIKWLNIANE